MIDKENIFNLGAPNKVEEIKSEYLEGESFYIREITARELDELQSAGARFAEIVKAGKPFRAMAAVKFLCDSEGTRLFSDSEAGKLQPLSSRLIDEIFEAGWKYNRVSQIGEVTEETEKN